MVQHSEKTINDYLDRRKELLINKLSNRRPERNSKISHMLKPIIDMQDLYGRSPPHKTSAKRSFNSTSLKSKFLRSTDGHSTSKRNRRNFEEEYESRYKHSIEKFNQFKERMKSEHEKMVQIEKEDEETSEDQDEQLCGENETNDKVEFKRFIRLQKDSMVNIKELVLKQ